MSKSLAIIPARGGSKRIPRKNIKEFMGKPAIWYPIQAALRGFDRVVVSTEDPEIRRVALDCGAGVVQRPFDLADDYTTTGVVAAETAKLFPEYDKIGMIYATAVFVTPQMIARAFNEMGEADCIFTVIKYGHPIQRALRIENGLLKFNNPEVKNVRTQDLEPMYNDAGMLYIMNRQPLIEHKNMYFENMKGLVIDEHEAQDMDTLEDWRLGEIKFEMLHRHGGERR